MEVAKKLQNLLGGGLIVSVVAFVGYILNYLYNYGYNQYFHVPATYIPFSLSSIFSSSWAVLLFVGYVLWAGGGFLLPTKEPKHKETARVFTNIGLLVAFFLAMTYLGDSRLSLIYMGSLILFLSFLWFVVPAIRNRTEGVHYKRKIQLHAASRRRAKVTSVIELVDQLFVHELGSFILAPLLIIAIAYNLGYSQARSQTVFYVEQAKPSANQWIVLRFMDENVLVGEINHKHSLTGHYQLQSLDPIGGSPRVLNRQFVGKVQN